MISLASTLTLCERRGCGRFGRLRAFFGRLLVVLVLAGLLAWGVHVLGHIHRACLKLQAEILEVAR